MSELRFNVVESAFYKKATTVEVPERRPCDYFGKYVLGREQMLHYLSAETYASLIDVIDNGAELDRKVADEVAEEECAPICFDGNGYSDEWKEEAARRGLDCETSCHVIFDNYLKPESVSMFENTGVMNLKELKARNEVKWEIYTKKIQVEARVLGDLSMNHIIPVATEYQSKLIDNVHKMMDIYTLEVADKLSAENKRLIEEIAEHTIYITGHVDTMIEARKRANIILDEREKAIAYHDTIAPMLEKIRYHIDKLELIVDNRMWPLPKYRELLFIR